MGRAKRKRKAAMRRKQERRDPFDRRLLRYIVDDAKRLMMHALQADREAWLLRGFEPYDGRYEP